VVNEKVAVNDKLHPNSVIAYGNSTYHEIQKFISRRFGQ